MPDTRTCDPWVKQPLSSFTSWRVVGTNVRWTEEGCERLTEARELRIIEDGATYSLAEMRHCENGTQRTMENGDIRTLEGFP